MPAMIVLPPDSPSEQDGERVDIKSLPSSSLQVDAICMDSLAFTTGDPIPLPPRFARIKEFLVAGRTALVHDSWRRLLVELRSEVERIADFGPDIIPTIPFDDITRPEKVDAFKGEFRRCGVAIIRGVVPAYEAAQWQAETRQYLSMNPRTKSFPTRDPHLFGVYWTPAQIKGRAHPKVLATQRFVMGMWHSKDTDALVSTNFPVTYADRMRIPAPGGSALYRNGHVDGGSVERWEPDGYGRAGTYEAIFQGSWEDYDPWESSTRLRVTSDLYNGAGSCSMFRMFQGFLSMAETSRAEGDLLLCPMLKLSTAYFLLRPFFSPRVPLSASASTASYLKEENWVLESQMSTVIQGALPSYTQELNAVLHPHLCLNTTMVRIPALQPGDYVLWHADLVYGVDHRTMRTFSHHHILPTSTASSNPAPASISDANATAIYIPACPLTQTNALYLARQRKAFLLGYPPPDFGGGRGESSHMGRPGVQEINEAGDEAGLRAMGLLPWEEGEAATEEEVEVLRMANGILFPDRYDMM